MFDPADYQLAWPRQLFLTELDAIQSSPRLGSAAVERLLAEAFHDNVPGDEFRAKASLAPAAVGGRVGSMLAMWLLALRQRVGELPELPEPRPYWSDRRSTGRGRTADRARKFAARRDFAALVDAFQQAGYLAQAFPHPCVDDRSAQQVDPAQVLEAKLGAKDLWPLQPRTWVEDTFYDLVEVFHDLVARPRDRWEHEYGGCGWHYGSFASAPGRRLYRWRVNRLLEDAGVGLRLADTGEDTGRLVETVDSGRAALVERLLAAPGTPVAGRVRHAIALFRGRGAGEEAKRSAIVALAGVLEERRALLKAELLSKDEGVLFHLANTFDLRHRNESQKADYDPVFLDWVFWWYLATVELTDRLLARQARGA